VRSPRLERSMTYGFGMIVMVVVVFGCSGVS
jgi:hypothetical protein